MNRVKWTLVALMLLCAAQSVTVAQDAKDAGVHEIQLTLKKYEFGPSTLRVKKGERVKLILVAVDHDHGFKLDEFDVNQKVQKGTTATVEFTADKAGTFQFRCSNVCGLGHRGMKGTLVVEE
jgi:cytochrome c oxidase subunit 2